MTGVRRGDRATDQSAQARKKAFRELCALWLGTLFLIRGVVILHDNLGIREEILALVPLLFIYAPVALCRWRKVDSWSYRLSIPAFRDGASWRAVFIVNLRVFAVIALPFVLGYHFYQGLLFGKEPGHGLPDALFTLAAYQIFFVAVPEEFFYRGYFQTRLNEVFSRRWLIFGTPMGLGAVFASLFFAFGHSLVTFQWWHFATFFPGLVFAWMRERTGGVMAGSVFHAICNFGVICLDTHYGLR